MAYPNTSLKTGFSAPHLEQLSRQYQTVLRNHNDQSCVSKHRTTSVAHLNKSFPALSQALLSYLIRRLNPSPYRQNKTGIGAIAAEQQARTVVAQPTPKL